MTIVQQVAVLFFGLYYILGLSFYLFCLLGPFNFYLIPVLFIYSVYNSFDKAPFSGSRKSIYHQKLLDRLFLMDHFSAYFPFKIIQDHEWNQSDPVIFACHPHGILSYSWLEIFATSVSNFAQLFPNIDVRLCTLNLQFALPFLREPFLSRGLISANRATITNCLLKRKSVAIVVGGAKESKFCEPGRHILVLKHRKGFIKLALETGCGIVPVYSFGGIF